MMYRALDILFVIFHTFLIIFNLIGWIWKKTRIANLVTLLLTGGSWFLLGLIVGTIGYCPLTDWHFKILEKLGRTGLPVSYVKYLADRITGLDFNSVMIDKVTLWSFIAALLFSIYFNLRDLKLRRRKH
jgi:hypothetical protein